ncbi:thiamine phosphate synthase [Adlercreutzia sp. ZJ141]|uniref:thiamine phosphate synthase n=1 Tax=Adlercreutzia sp. ZJ141 TaxID=2709406 RepID=UPI0013EA3957|nr:thiamine phosphate synthase [Adlercreutzia sp. ZJ141]
MRGSLDISAYLVIGPENTNGRAVADVVGQAIDAGFTCVQVRSKECSARELIDCTVAVADVIARRGMGEQVALLVDDRVDVALAARARGAKVDGVHVGQSDIPVDVCRELLGPDAIVGLSARTAEMLEYVKTADMSVVDYLGVGPLHETATKPDCGMDAQGNVITKDFDDLRQLAQASPVPIVVGGGVKLADVPLVRNTGAAGFFVVSAVCGATDPYEAAKSLVDAWRAEDSREGDN